MDSFKEQIEKITSDARQKHLQDIETSKRLALQRREDSKAMMLTAEAFCDRVIKPVLAEFSSAAQVDDFVREYLASESQPTFSYSCDVHQKRMFVEVVYWLAGSAQIQCDFGYRSNDTSFKIGSFDEPGLDEEAILWLKKKLLEKYQAHLALHPRVFPTKD
ncbi:MAG: hypothetical protein ACK5YR_09275 [Pirellula sp.]|jgi:hypothetical protein